MTGTPLRTFFPTLIVVILLGGLLYKITTPATTSHISTDLTPTAPTETIRTLITVKCAHQPESLVISCGGTPLHQFTAPALLEELECDLPISSAPLTLTVDAHWPTSTPDTPVTLELEPQGKPTISVTRWSFGPDLNDSFSFSWK